MSEIRICRACGEEKPAAQFREYAPGKTRHKCRACEAPAQREYVKRNKLKTREELRTLRLAKETAPEAKLIGQLTQDEFAELLNRLLEERETALLLS